MTPALCIRRDALQFNTTLKRLDLSGNAIDKSGTEAIAEALKGNSGLESLQIRYGQPGTTEQLGLPAPCLEKVVHNVLLLGSAYAAREI